VFYRFIVKLCLTTLIKAIKMMRNIL